MLTALAFYLFSAVLIAAALMVTASRNPVHAVLFLILAFFNAEALGRVIYTDYVYYFETAGLILLVAMIGAIVLTLRHKPNARRQKISLQNARDPRLAIRLVDVPPGQGG